MKTEESNSVNQRNVAKRLSTWAAMVAVILMVPLLTRAPWTAGDFLFAGVVLFACATAYELTTRNMNNAMHRAGVAAAVLLFIFLVMGWAAAGPD